MSYCQHLAVAVVEVGPFQGSYQAYCPECLAGGGEAVTTNRVLANFHARNRGRAASETNMRTLCVPTPAFRRPSIIGVLARDRGRR